MANDAPMDLEDLFTETDLHVFGRCRYGDSSGADSSSAAAALDRDEEASPPAVQAAEALPATLAAMHAARFDLAAQFRSEVTTGLLAGCRPSGSLSTFSEG